jgi:U3 small nucleolar RNA-associated protein 19
VSALVLCPPSHRTSSTDGAPAKKRKVVSERELVPDVREAFTETWLTVHDDIRWFFLREAALVSMHCICELLLMSTVARSSRRPRRPSPPQTFSRSLSG